MCNCNISMLPTNVYLKHIVTWEKFSSSSPTIKLNGLHIDYRHVNLCKASVMNEGSDKATPLAGFLASAITNSAN